MGQRSTTSTTHRFYTARSPALSSAPSAPSGLAVQLWRPSWRSIPPLPIRDKVHWIWWLFHNLHVFANREYAVVLILREEQVIHRSTIFPGFFRFPFMRPADLQIGATWTDPSARGRGLAGFAIRFILASNAQPQRRFWYIVEADNPASIRVIEKEGFELEGCGNRLAWAGLRQLGYYAITQPTAALPMA